MYACVDRNRWNFLGGFLSRKSKSLRLSLTLSPNSEFYPSKIIWICTIWVFFKAAGGWVEETREKGIIREEKGRDYDETM